MARIGQICQIGVLRVIGMAALVASFATFMAAGAALLPSAAFAQGPAPAFSRLAGMGPQAGPQSVTLQLKWVHQFQFAGYYAARHKGFYEQEGLDVQILEGGPQKPVMDEVMAGRADFGIGDSDALLVNRIKGKPVLALAAIFQHSPYVFMSRADRRIRTPSDLVGKTVMASKDHGDIELRAMLRGEGINAKRVKVVPQSGGIEDLISGKVDVMATYGASGLAFLAAKGIEPSVLRSVDYGVDFYGDVLYTTEQQVQDNPERTAAFLRASLKGWNYALQHPQEIAGVIASLDGVKKRGVTEAMLVKEASEMESFILPDVVEVGHLNRARMDKIAKSLAALGAVESGFSLEGFIYEAPRPVSLRILQWSSAVGFLVLLIAMWLILWYIKTRERVEERTQQLREKTLEKERIEEDLRLSQKLVEMTFGAAASGLVMTTLEGKLVMSNPACGRIFGYSTSDLTNMDVRHLISEEDKPRHDRLRSQLIAGEIETFSDEKRCIKKDGSQIWVSSKMSLIRSASGEPTHVISVLEDITERRMKDQRLLLLETAVSRLNDIVVITEAEPIDKPGPKILFVNDAFERRTGYTRDEVIGQSPRILQGPKTQRAGLDEIRRAMKAWKPSRTQLINYTKTGEEFWIELDIVPIADETGWFTHWVSVERDITERKKIEAQIEGMNAELEERVHLRTAQLEATNKELEAFSYTVSHDLRSPLNTINGFGQLLEKSTKDKLSEKEHHYLNRIRAGAKQMGSLIDDLLALAKVSRDPIKQQDVDLTEISRRVLRECSEREPERQVVVQVEDGLMARGDTTLLSIVISNLIWNAWKFTSKKEGAAITIGRLWTQAHETIGTLESPEGGASPDEMVYFVQDNGAGFDMAHADKLFGTFQRLHSPIDFAGTGVGLATVHRIIERHGGRIWATSAVDEGARFCFTLGDEDTHHPVTSD